MSIAAVLTAGGRVSKAQFPSDGLTEISTATSLQNEPYVIKCLLRIGKRSLLEIALDAIRRVPGVEKVVVVGSRSLQQWLREQEVLVPERQEAHENFMAGLEAAVSYPRVLYITTDLPFVTAEAICHFVDSCPTEAQLCYAIARREVFDARFPNSPSTYTRLRDGEFAAGCAALVEPRPLLERAEWIRRAAQRRKSLWRLALLVGARVMWKYATRQLTVADVEHRVEELLKMRCRAVECLPELACDIDTGADYLYALRYADGRND